MSTGSAPPPALFLTGPTASGKTAAAALLARRWPYAMISADSMQVYRGMEIGTAQPAAAELRGLPIELCGVVEPGEPFSVKKFLDLADAARERALAAGKVPLFVGGTGMYLRSLRFGLLAQGPQGEADKDQGSRTVRLRLENELCLEGPEALHKKLAVIDPPLAARIHPRDRVRIVRGLEVAETSGVPLSRLQSEWAGLQEPVPRFPHRLLVLAPPRTALAARIGQRVDEMLAAGWVEEVRRLLAEGVPPEAHCFKAIGYPEVLAVVEGRLTAGEAAERIKTATRRFAKRQMTWFRKEPGAEWIETGGQSLEETALSVEKALDLPSAPF